MLSTDIKMGQDGLPARQQTGPGLPEPDAGPVQRPILAPRCVSIDLEVGVKDAKIHAFAGVRGDTGSACVYQRG
ncbi:hypothetical protein, partial [Massilia alkalitolerans]|uniref:hypothetical protein n=1 Tax=Massilia alkalitolerans TaxID=286638 RepID=UPI0028B02B8C